VNWPRFSADLRRIYHGWWVVAACFVIAAFGWGLGLFGASVYLQAITAAKGWPVSQVASAITLLFLVSAAAQKSVARSIARWGPRPVLSFGAVALAAGPCLIGQVSAPWQIYPCFVVLGLGWAILSTTGITTTVAPWFERHQGRSMTLAVMGASLGAIVGVPLLLLALHRLGLSLGLAVAGLASAAVLLPMISQVMRFRGPAALGLAPDGGIASARDAAAAPLATAASPRLLWSTAIGFALAMLVQIGFITHHVVLAAPLLGSAGAGLLVSATGLAAFAGRLVLAAIVDRVEPRRLAVYVMALQAGALLAIACWPVVPVLIGASLVYGYAIGHVTTLGPIVVRREFGAQQFGALYGRVATAVGFTSAFGPALFGLLRDGLGSYRPGLVIASALVLAASLTLLVGGGSAARRAVGR